VKASEVLDSAANIILRDGWNQDSYFKLGGDEDESNKSGPCCQAGAISRAAFGYAWVNHGGVSYKFELHEARRKADYYMARYLLHTRGESSPICWNDDPERTAEEVVAALRGAAELAREAGE
jgi:hypothetical protein